MQYMKATAPSDMIKEILGSAYVRLSPSSKRDHIVCERS